MEKEPVEVDMEFSEATMKDLELSVRKWLEENRDKVSKVKILLLTVGGKGPFVLRIKYTEVDPECKGDCAGCPCRRN